MQCVKHCDMNKNCLTKCVLYNYIKKNILYMAKHSKLIPDTRAIELYEKMYLARRFEEKAGQMYGMGKIAGFCHLYIGQEAVIAGIYAAIEKKDQVITSYRDHAHAIFAGTDPKYVMAELFGK